MPGGRSTYFLARTGAASVLAHQPHLTYNQAARTKHTGKDVTAVVAKCFEIL